MKMRIIVLQMWFLSLFCGIASADRTLERAEILQILSRLTNQPQKTWITAGTIQAIHEDYKAPKVIDANIVESAIRAKIQGYSNNPDRPKHNEEMLKMDFDAVPFNTRYEMSNESTMKSSVVVKYDGEKFYWEINVDSRNDSVNPGKELADNFMLDRFDREWNQKRIFVWDGEKYTTYFLPGNYSIEESKSASGHAVNGPLTAGLIPWGYGYYSYNSLAAADLNVIEREINGEILLQLTINLQGSLNITLTLDPSQNYNVLSYLSSSEKSLVYRKYSNHQLIAGKRIPMMILEEKYDSRNNRLLSRELWTITSIDTAVPAIESFKVKYENDAQIEFTSPVTSKPVLYRYSGTTDTDSLLSERLASACLQDSDQQNCATISLKYSLSKLNKSVSLNSLSALVSADKTTSLASMKQYIKNQGLYCLTVKTDIQTIKNINNCQKILYIPGDKHFVVLEKIDDKYAWIIDLSRNKFYYHIDKDFFNMDWTDGVALLISNQPIRQEGNLIELTEDELANTIGTGYACTGLLQEYHYITCSDPILPGTCDSYYYDYFERKSCQLAAEGSCSSSVMPRYQKCPCQATIEDPFICDKTYEWTISYIRACQ